MKCACIMHQRGRCCSVLQCAAVCCNFFNGFFSFLLSLPYGFSLASVTTASVDLSVYLSVCLCACLSVCLPVCLLACLSV